MNVAIIPARGGSRRIKNKNRRPFFGKPIIAYSIETAKASGLFDKIVVSSDSAHIRDIALQYGAQSTLRSAEMSRDEVGTQEVMADLLSKLDPLPTYACCIYPTAPLMTAFDLARGFDALRQRDDLAFAYSVGIDPFRDAGQWYWGRTSAFLSGVPLDPQGWNVMKVVIPNDRVCDINTEKDWIKAEQMYLKFKEVA